MDDKTTDAAFEDILRRVRARDVAHEQQIRDPFTQLAVALGQSQHGRGSHRYFYHTTNPDAVLAYSHYSDPLFNRERGICIYGADAGNLTWVYADRLLHADPDKSDAAWKQAVEQHGKERTARRIETYLRLYFERSLTLACIISGTQQSNGYPWYAYGIRFLSDQPTPPDPPTD